MFEVYVDTVTDLRSSLLPLANICSKADIKCSADKLLITIMPSAYPFVASLRLAPTFFTSFDFTPDGDGDDVEEYCARFVLSLFLTNISNLYSDDLSLTIYLRQQQPLAPLKFEDPFTGYLQYSALVISRPLNIGISPIEFGVFVAIHAAEFFMILTQLSSRTHRTAISVTVTKSKAKFKNETKEIVLDREYLECVIGGVPRRRKHRFQIILFPMYFFFHLTFLCKWVWLFKTVSSRNLLTFCVGLDASYVVCF